MRQVFGKQNHVSRGGGNLRAAAHGHGHMGGGERRGIVDAVAHHGHDGTLVGERMHARELVLREQIGLDLADAGLARHALGRAGMITGEQQHAFAVTLEFSDERLGAGAHLIADHEGGEQLAGVAQQHQGIATGAQGCQRIILRTDARCFL